MPHGFDYHPNGYNNLYLPLLSRQGTDTQPGRRFGPRGNDQAEPQNGVFGWQSILNQDASSTISASATTVHARASTARRRPSAASISPQSRSIFPAASLTPASPGRATSSGISIPGGLVRANSATNGRGQPYTPYSIRFIDSLSWTRGNHNIKFGGEVRLIRLYTDRLGGTTYTFSNLAGISCPIRRRASSISAT